MKQYKKLSRTEMQFMELIWNHPEGITSSEIYPLFPQTMGAKSTLLRRIIKKGYARSEQIGKYTFYYPMVKRLEYEKLTLNAELEKKMGIELKTLFANLCGKESLSEEQNLKLEKLFEELSKKNE
ncbi:Penicillinase repressor [Clostridiales bacterium CHKCI001]|nr:Penicillinase repressor [Clostridiales bacterium CHKCI001]